jgi:ubiquinone biosynthesis protein
MRCEFRGRDVLLPESNASRDAESKINLEDWLPAIREQTGRIINFSRAYASGMVNIYVAMRPLTSLINRQSDIDEAELHEALDALFEALKRHPLNEQIAWLTRRLRDDNVLPNEASTENLLKFLMDQFTARSVIPIPDKLTEEFWSFFNDLMSEPQLKGLGEVGLDVLRILVTAYEPLILKVINQLKHVRSSNNHHLREIYAQTAVLRSDLEIFRRQIGALAYIPEYFRTDPQDLKTQARIVAQMVREFGPFFIKMAQVAASGSDFLPEEISDALEVFHEDVEPMTPEEVEQAFEECFGESPSRRYYDFDASRPIKSGSIASVYLARKPVRMRRGGHELQTIVVKVGRHNLEREFIIGKTVIKLAILSSQYWAPHSKLSPFLSSWQEQVDVFVEGFRAELDFEAEAAVQARFAERAAFTGGWHVPAVHETTRRIIEMEYVDRAHSLTTAFKSMGQKRGLRARRKVGRAFLHAVVSHLLIYREFHGDLHPGNLLVDQRQRVYFIDWGNSIDLGEIWRPALRYLQAVFAADAAAVADAMIDLGTHPEQLRGQHREILALVEEALQEARLAPLGIDFPLVLHRQGPEGLKRRVDLAISLMTIMSRQGIVINDAYMHLGRSVTALVGSYLGIYSGLSRWVMARDALFVLYRFPSLEGYRQAQGYRRQVLRQVAQDLPVSFIWRSRSAKSALPEKSLPDVSRKDQ